MARWLVTGAGGMLGGDVAAVLAASREHEGVALPRTALDITDAEAVASAVDGFDVVVNAAAYTAVDTAERDEEAAHGVNATGPGTLAGACARRGTPLLHVSTDHVFPGTSEAPHPESAATAPVNAYGRGKLAGERLVRSRAPDSGYIVRTAWLYGIRSSGFVPTMLDASRRHAAVDVVTDQVGQPTWSPALAAWLVHLGKSALAGRASAGTYHATAVGAVSRYELAREIFTLAGAAPGLVRPTTTVPTGAAPRPRYTVLAHTAHQAAGLPLLEHWRPMLKRALSTARRPV
ncbi:dTDP-4-dehydrorhamnose reductase [Nocardiopsis kunsanensis]|uniref:dTDP-4-dehydrorhamnose reductase n=1 Tax=Nocardiopsis kunsanensis TaxID=141693 RepID=UPI0003451CEA|nr:dTDP-4-dehydrorhamnose reductase [Nocardiopsis kunsanensis]